MSSEPQRHPDLDRIIRFPLGRFISPENIGTVFGAADTAAVKKFLLMTGRAACCNEPIADISQQQTQMRTEGLQSAAQTALMGFAELVGSTGAKF